MSGHVRVHNLLQRLTGLDESIAAAHHDAVQSLGCQDDICVISDEILVVQLGGLRGLKFYRSSMVSWTLVLVSGLW